MWAEPVQHISPTTVFNLHCKHDGETYDYTRGQRESETHPYQRFSPAPLQNSFRRIHQVITALLLSIHHVIITAAGVPKA